MKPLSIAFFTAAAVAIATLSISNLILPKEPPQAEQETAAVATTTEAIATSTPALPEENTKAYLKAYGKNDHGQMTGAVSDAYSRKDISLSLAGKVKMLAAGKSHSVALTDNGYVYSWGLNDAGQLGRKSASRNESKPALVPELTDIVSISTSYNHTLALSSAGTVYAWGQNYTGQIGNGTNTNAPSPVEVKGLPEIIAIAAGHKLSLALAKNGDVYAWGGSCNTDNKKKALALLEKVGGQLTSLQGGYYDSTATGDTAYDISQDCLNEDAVNIKSATPIKLPVSGVKMIAAGYGHAILLKTDGTVIGMGCNTFGQAGRMPGIQKGELVPIEGLPKIVSIAAGARHSLFLDADGNVYGVGSNSAGQVGDRSRIDKSTPVKIADISDVTKLYAGYDYSLAITKTGSMWAWGNNTDEFFIRAMPIKIDFPLTLFEKAPRLTGAGGAHVLFSF
jgi:alpha-tubulin suppressor-like RCC1 family protein